MIGASGVCRRLAASRTSVYCGASGKRTAGSSHWQLSGGRGGKPFGYRALVGFRLPVRARTACLHSTARQGGKVRAGTHLLREVAYKKSPADKFRLSQDLTYRLGAELVGPGAGGAGATGPLVAEGILLVAVRSGPRSMEL
jgi:hypothetical protein